jgi:trans-aconitate 2-methyltransferase
MLNWDAQLYLQFATERTQPAIDLIARINIASSPEHIIDLGCGPGNSTAMLRQRWPEATITGLDSSAEMIAAASQAYPAGKWVLANAASWTAEVPYDIVFSNAALQWLPDHAKVFPHLMRQLAPNGVLAVQVPAHYESPLQRVVFEVADNSLWSSRMDAARNALTNERPPFYYNVLRSLASHLDIWETEYFHDFESPRSIVEWFRGTGLRPFLDALETEEHKQLFEQMVLDGYTRAYPRQENGRVLFPFRRLFLIAYS